MHNIILNQLKAIFPPSSQGEDAVYNSVMPYLEHRILSKGTILKRHNTIEDRSRLILDGIVCMYTCSEAEKPKAIKVFVTGQVALDLESYTDQKSTDTMLVAKTPISILELMKSSENLLLQEVPGAAQLAIRINHLLGRDLLFWEKLRLMPYQEAYMTLINLYPNLGNVLKVGEIKEILGMGKSTLSRIRKVRK